MSKTDKELTVDLVNNYVNSWNGSSSTNNMDAKTVASIIELFYTTVQNLPVPKDDAN